MGYKLPPGATLVAAAAPAQPHGGRPGRRGTFLLDCPGL